MKTQVHRLPKPETLQAVITAVNANDFTGDLVNSSEEITILPRKHLGENDLNGDVWPHYDVDDVLTVYQVDGVWYCNDVFDDIEDLPE